MALRVALVTGGGSGLGRAVALKLLKENFRVVVADLHDVDKRFSLCNRIKFVKTDVCDENDVQRALDVACELGQGEQVSAVVNCAGIASAQKTWSKGKSHSLTDFAKVLNINVTGTFNVCRLAATRMIARKSSLSGQRGVIVNTASIAAFDGTAGQVAYSASKAAVAGLTLPMARDLSSHGIRVCCVAPGLFETPLLAGLPEKARKQLEADVPNPSRLGRADEFADLVHHIVRNEMLNGEVIRLDGALRMR